MLGQLRAPWEWESSLGSSFVLPYTHPLLRRRVFSDSAGPTGETQHLSQPPSGHVGEEKQPRKVSTRKIMFFFSGKQSNRWLLGGLPEKNRRDLRSRVTGRVGSPVKMRGVREERRS